MYDRYKHWWPADTAPIRPISRMAIEEQVLEDLEKAQSESEKLEILDSYFVYAQRVYRVREINNFSDQVGSMATKLAGIFLSHLMPEVTPPYRPAYRPAKAVNEQ